MKKEKLKTVGAVHTRTRTGNLKNKKGITLVALVVTIIILLILAGVAISQLTRRELLDKAKFASEETNKNNAIEMMNLKISDIQTLSYIENQKVTTLQYLADKLCEDNDIEYVQTLSQKISSNSNIDTMGYKSIYTKLKEYPYEFEIDSSLKLIGVDGIEIATGKKIEKQLVEEIILSKAKVSIEKDKTITINALVKPENSYTNLVNWSVSDTDVVKISNINLNEITLTTVGYGNATITAKSQDGSNIIATCEIEVIEPITKDDITSNLKSYIGKKVNYTGNESVESVGWRIYYVDDNNIYIIADDYVKSSYLKQISGIGFPSTYCVNASSSASSFESYLRTKSNWTNFVIEEIASYALGSPTKSMFDSSVQAYGSYINGTHYHSSKTKANGIWLSYKAGHVFYIAWYTPQWTNTVVFTSKNYGVCPLVCLKENAVLIEQEDGSYNIKVNE